MLENSITIFSIQLPNKEVKNKALVISGCNAILTDEKTVYTELDELNFSNLNINDYGLWTLNIEFSFVNNFDDPYFEFYAGCFAIRTDTGLCIKKNGYPHLKCFSKINKDNKVSVGILYYFKSEEEKNKIENCNMFCIEGNIAIGKKSNVYGIMCRLSRTDEVWQVIDANTYRTHKGTSIGSLVH
jgi:hypothetical protein